MFNFDNMITPKILSVLYILATLACVFLALYIGRTNIFQGIAWIAAAVIIRVPFELMVVSFKNNEYLRRICEAAEAKKSD
ncbi:hypothetical protein HV073_12025 [Klebsiella michiganensis]|uniref:hypothetical protein n=1 Tax=Klebsiella/Raoultella group TaxID=2890311 RepID=UPI0013E378B3|nr:MULTISPECIES: hypothetical protein [Klebsiella/Raoultella group]EKQ6536955.1 hypothetical protein [Klebsiella michiganensis]ELI6943024.1 hypothetical protein [Klebsiella oxytoca]ELQ7987753.1 hypothetical protein [Klebsiella michiganensis]MBA8052290.1 hypothetical protein [Klebsiella michiganensis]MBM9584508.1 hypothetical protein [Klebsiella oxytoca]